MTDLEGLTSLRTVSVISKTGGEFSIKNRNQMNRVQDDKKMRTKRYEEGCIETI